jgi:hypothetical protein
LGELVIGQSFLGPSRGGPVIAVPGLKDAKEFCPKIYSNLSELSKWLD